MIVKAQLKSYEEVKFSITLTAPVTDWRAVMKQLANLKDHGWTAWPLSGFVGCIEKMLSDLDKTHTDVLLKQDQMGAFNDPSAVRET